MIIVMTIVYKMIPHQASFIWLCYGGGGGEGGYAGYGGTERRLRIYEIDSNKGTISTWKRLNSSPKEIFDYQIILNNDVPDTV